MINLGPFGSYTFAQLNDLASFGYRILGMAGWILALACMMKYLRN